MRVLVICSQFPPRPSPESNHSMLLCEALAGSGTEAHLLTSPLLPGAPEPRGYSLHPVMESWGWGGARHLMRVARRIRPDVILLIYVGWIYDKHPMITFAPSFLRWAVPRSAFVTQFENSLGAEVWGPRNRIKWVAAAALAKGRNLETRFGSLLAESDAVIALSDRHLDGLAGASPCAADKTTVIAAPPLLRIRRDGRVARSEGRRHLGLAPDNDETLVLAYFGYVYPGKGVETLLKAIVLLKQRKAYSKVPAFKLVIVGDVTDHNLAEELTALKLNLEPSDSPLWLGHKENEEASTFLWATDIAILPFDEGIRLNNSSFAVCAAHGLPVITTQGQQLEPAFKQMENVLLCPPKDAGALASAIERLLTSPALRARLGAGAAMLSKNVFSWETNTNATMKVLKSAQDSRGREGAKPAVKSA